MISDNAAPLIVNLLQMRTIMPAQSSVIQKLNINTWLLKANDAAPLMVNLLRMRTIMPAQCRCKSLAET